MRKIAICALFSFFCLNMIAQEVANQKAKEINEVKLSEQAMYAEVVELASDDFEAVSLAQQKTINKLQNNVIEACAHRMNITKEQAKEIFDVIDDKCQNIVIKKGDMVRVFAYIAKDAVGLSRKKAKQKDIDEIFGAEEDTDSTMIADNVSQAMNLLMGKKDSIDNVTTAVAVDEVKKTVEPQPVIQPIVTSVSEPVEKPKPEPKIEAKPEPVTPVSVPAICQTMIDKGNMKELMRYLNQEKRCHRLMFGNSGAMQRPEKC